MHFASIPWEKVFEVKGYCLKLLQLSIQKDQDCDFIYFLLFRVVGAFLEMGNCFFVWLSIMMFIKFGELHFTLLLLRYTQCLLRFSPPSLSGDLYKWYVGKTSNITRISNSKNSNVIEGINLLTRFPIWTVIAVFSLHCKISFYFQFSKWHPINLRNMRKYYLIFLFCGLLGIFR